MRTIDTYRHLLPIEPPLLTEQPHLLALQQQQFPQTVEELTTILLWSRLKAYHLFHCLVQLQQHQPHLGYFASLSLELHPQQINSLLPIFLDLSKFECFFEDQKYLRHSPHRFALMDFVCWNMQNHLGLKYRMCRMENPKLKKPTNLPIVSVPTIPLASQ